MTFSGRLPAELRSNRLTRLVEELRRDGTPFLDLTESNPTRAGIVYPGERIARALAQPGMLAYEPEPFGRSDLRAHIAALNGVQLEQVILTASTSEAYAYLFKLLCDAGDEVLAPRPSYPLFDLLAALESVTVRQYPLRYHEGWFIDFDALEAQVTPRTRAIILVHPNNPTGSYLKTHEFERLAALGLPLISDEVFGPYALSAPLQRMPSLALQDRVLSFALDGLSKRAGLPQMKLAWMLVGGPRKQCEAATERLEIIADTYLSVGAPVQFAAQELLSLSEEIQAQILDRVRRNFTRLRASLANSPVTLLDIEGGWYATLRAPRTISDEERATALLRDAGVFVQPGDFYDFEAEGYLVLSLLTPEQVFAEGITRLLAAIH